jgi:hypothetical protein
MGSLRTHRIAILTTAVATGAVVVETRAMPPFVSSAPSSAR